MSTFTGGLQAFAKKTVANQRAVFTSTVAQMQASIKYGSALTGAPAMPVSLPKYPKSGSLRDSVTTSFSDADHALIYTTKWFAPRVEDNTDNHTFVSGGPGGWKLTIAAFERIVDTTAVRIAGAK